MLFDGLRFSAETDQCLTASFLRGEAALEVFFDRQVQVRGQFGGQLLIQFFTAEHGGDPMEKLLQPVNHWSPPSYIPRTRLMTLASLCQLTASSESCLRPFFVME